MLAGETRDLFRRQCIVFLCSPFVLLTFFSSSDDNDDKDADLKGVKSQHAVHDVLSGLQCQEEHRPLKT